MNNCTCSRYMKLIKDINICSLNYELTVSMVFRNRRHIPCRLYTRRVAINGISATLFSWTLFEQLMELNVRYQSYGNNITQLK